MNYIEIWEPRWSTRDVLIAEHKPAKSKPMKVEYKNLEITMEGAESLVSDMGDADEADK